MERREAIGVRRHEKDTRRMPVAGVGLYRLTRYTIKTVKVSGYGSFGGLIRSGKWQIAPVRSCRNACTVTSRWNCCRRGVDSILRWRRDSASTNSHLAVNYLAVHGSSLAFQKKVARCRLAPEPKKTARESEDANCRDMMNRITSRRLRMADVAYGSEATRNVRSHSPQIAIRDGNGVGV